MKPGIFNIGKYINNVTGLQFFQIFRFSILLLISIIFTKSHLGVGEIGVYEMFIMIAGGVSFFWIGGFLQALLSIHNNNKTYILSEKSSLFFNVFILFCLLSFIAGVFVYITQETIASFLNLSGPNIPYMKILFMYICLSGPVNMIEYIYLLKNKSRWIIYYGSSTFTLQLFCVTVPILLGYDLGYGLYGLVFVNGIRFIWLLLLLYKYSKPSISLSFIKEYAHLSGPLILSMLLSGSASYVDSFLVSNKYDEATFAIFRYGARELPFLILFINAFANALTPTFSDFSKISSSLKNLKNEARKLMHYLFPFAILAIIFSKTVFPIVFNEKFYDSAVIFNFYMLIIITRFIFSRTILIGLKKSKAILNASLIEVVINITLSIILINYLGLIGVALATLISFFIEKLYLVYYLKSKLDIKLNQYLDIKVLFFYSLALVVSFLVSLYC